MSQKNGGGILGAEAGGRVEVVSSVWAGERW